MKIINIKGRIIGNGSKWIYDWLDIPATCPKDVSSVLQDVNNEDIEIHINSGGGSVYDGYEIYNAIAEYKGNVTIKIVGLAASAASFISQAPNAKCYMSPLAEMMIHNSSTYAEGQHQIMDSTSQMLQVTDATIAKAYTLKSGKSDKEIRALMEAETWLTSEQAKELGLIDGILFESKTEPKQSYKLYNALNLDDDIILSDLEKCKTIDELKNRLTENLDKMFKNASQNQPTVINAVVENKKQEENKMNLEQLKSDHADLYNQIVQDVTAEAVTNERARIKSINDLAMPGLENLINEGIEKGDSAEKVAMNIIKAQKEKGLQHIQDAKQDAINANLNNVSSVAVPEKTDTKQDALNLLVSAAESITGGR
ncbi:head maturation protease, ClpP-related [Clostridium magnum]|uniref:ATP-dependent Clp protease proteolytic subunit n=1 Tax=Clostridium magnum DSM 2767 TaxID=1121326 RepID=A0A161X4B3_9CLOT|nr:head maturation protease, ClpP-related [Clostridium magnum]KZL88706.1 ATP-dependent Clp protease proteolytic subunit [Clostridium magnum DSM 2767]SHJ44409.1 ATP-dependent Clp endopeptidase, proteolytic subunit ClpP [Clostridium magnum DSM 2767]